MNDSSFDLEEAGVRLAGTEEVILVQAFQPKYSEEMTIFFRKILVFNISQRRLQIQQISYYNIAF